jgi:alkaline phosphatase
MVDANHDGNIDSDDDWHLVQTRAEFQNLITGPTPKRVVGTARVYQTLQQGRSGDGNADPYVVPLIQTVPTLAEMSLAAINVLDDDPDGFCLMVEGGAVDWASHANQTGRMIEEEEDFNAAVDAVVGWIEGNSSWGETLLIVTGDHETGYLTRYASGGDTPWADQPLGNRGPGQVVDVQWNSGSHTNALIPFYAKGRGAHLYMLCVSDIDLVRGVYIDNTAVAKVIFWLLMVS